MKWFLVLALMIAASSVGGQTITGMSGTLDHGETVTISGSGFGSKSPAAPYLWDNFDSGTAGTKVTTPLFGAYADGTDARENYYTSSTSWSGGQAMTWSSASDPTGHPGFHIRWSGTAGRYGFVSFKWKATSSEGSTYSAIHIKLIRLQSQSVNYTSGVPNWDVGMDRGSTTFTGVANHGPPDPSHDFYIGSAGSGSYSIGGWNDSFLAMDVGTTGSANADLLGAMNGSHYSATNKQILYPAYTVQGLRGALALAYVDEQGYDVTVTLDDVYADNTLARVVLADEPVWTSTTERAMQIPSAWSSSSISFTVNTGPFVSASTKYLYVFDSNGNMSGSYAVVIGEAGGGIEPPALTAPTNLQVNGGN